MRRRIQNFNRTVSDPNQNTVNQNNQDYIILKMFSLMHQIYLYNKSNTSRSSITGLIRKRVLNCSYLNIGHWEKYFWWIICSAWKLFLCHVLLRSWCGLRSLFVAASWTSSYTFHHSFTIFMAAKSPSSLLFSMSSLRPTSSITWSSLDLVCYKTVVL